MNHFRHWGCIFLPFMVVVLAVACSKGDEPLAGETGQEEADMMTIQITSPVFEAGGPIPQKYSCDGENLSPPLAWSGVPGGTAGLALIMDDPDAPAGTWVHWIVYDIAPETTGLPENVPADGPVPGDGIQGKNSWNRTGYGGPCPPRGTHRYFFKLYALDTILSPGTSLDKDKLLKAMAGHILAQGQLMGTYRR